MPGKAQSRLSLPLPANKDNHLQLNANSFPSSFRLLQYFCAIVTFHKVLDLRQNDLILLPINGSTALTCHPLKTAAHHHLILFSGRIACGAKINWQMSEVFA